MPNKVAYHSIIIDVATGIGTAATITVYAGGTTDLATIYSDKDGTAEDNPFDTDSSGRLVFFADPGEYNIKVSGTGLITYTLEWVSIYADPNLIMTSEPTSGQYQVKGIRLDSTKQVLVKYDETAES